MAWSLIAERALRWGEGHTALAPTHRVTLLIGHVVGESDTFRGQATYWDKGQITGWNPTDWSRPACCNCAKERGWDKYDQKGCRQCKNRAAAKIAANRAAPEKASTGKASAAVKQGRRDKATNLDAWLRDFCGIDEEEERTEIVDAFMDPRCRVNSTPKLFALEEKDLDTIMASLSLGTLRLVKSAWLEERPSGGSAGG